MLPGCKQIFSVPPCMMGASRTHVYNWSLKPVPVVTVVPEVYRLTLCYRRSGHRRSVQSLSPCWSVSLSDYPHVSAWLLLDGFPWNLILLISYENPSRSFKFSYKRAEISGTLHKSLATGWTVRGSNPSGGEIFRTCPDRPWGPPSLLYNGYRVFPGGKERPGRDADPHPF